jgi:hypothetical protein
VESYTYEQHDPDNPEQLPIAEFRHTHFPQEPGISINLGRASEYLQIAQHVSDNKQNKHDAGDCHHHLFADLGVPEGQDGLVTATFLVVATPSRWTTGLKSLTLFISENSLD